MDTKSVSKNEYMASLTSIALTLRDLSVYVGRERVNPSIVTKGGKVDMAEVIRLLADVESIFRFHCWGMTPIPTDRSYIDSEAPYAAEAEAIAACIKQIAESPAKLDNFQSYLSHHLLNWLVVCAYSPERFVEELRIFARLDEGGGPTPMKKPSYTKEEIDKTIQKAIDDERKAAKYSKIGKTAKQAAERGRVERYVVSVLTALASEF